MRQGAESGMREGAQTDSALQALSGVRDLIGVFLVVLDHQGRIAEISQRACELLGYAPEELLGRDWFAHCLPPAVRERTRQVFERLLAGETEDVRLVEQAVLARNGDQPVLVWRNTALRDAAGRVTGTFSTGEEVTELRRGQRALRALSACNQAMLAAEGPEALAPEITRRLTDVAGYPFAWYGRVAGEAHHAACHSGAADYLAAVAADQGPVAEALRRGAPVIVPRIADSFHRYGDWTVHALEQGYGAAAALPVPSPEGPGLAGVLLVHTREPGALDGDEAVILTELARDFGHALRLGRAEASLQAMARFPEENPNPVLRVRADGVLLYANPAARGLLADQGLAVGAPVTADAGRAVADALATGAAGSLEQVWDGRHFLFSVAPVPEGGYVNLYGMDITARRTAEEHRRRSESRLKTYTEATPAYIYELDRDGRILFANRVYEELTVDEVLGTELAAWFPEDEADGIRAIIAEVGRSGQGRELRYTVTDLKGQLRHYIADLRPLAEGRRADSLLLTATDITELERARAAAQAGRELVSNLVEAIPFAVFWKDRSLVYRGGNTRFARNGGLPDAGALAGKTDFDLAWRPQEAEAFRRDDQEVLTTGRPKLDIEAPLRRADGTETTVLTSKVPLRDASGRVSGVLGIYADITERKRTEQALSRLNRSLRAVSACNEVLIRATDEEQLVASVCGLIVDIGGHALAWMGFATDDGGVRLAAAAGADIQGDAALAALNAALAPRLAAGGLHFIHEDRAADPEDPVSRFLQERGLSSALILALRADGVFLGLLGICARQSGAFDAEELKLLRELGDDLAFGVGALRTRAGRARAEQALQQTLDQTIGAVALTLEKRDPYTAGHQMRVAELCTAIARHLGLDAERVRGLRLGALIHDIGKIYVPAEILNRPGRLSAIEFDLIKSHPEVGYEIVQDVHFPWPVATMIRQHHERLDGSGYPLGIRGDEILPESRILAVADVAEAMLSHRPYRPARGVDAALATLEEGRGHLFDPTAVDACVTLFRRRGFRFSH